MKNIFLFLKKNYLLFVILLLAIFLRFYNFNSFPPSLNWDEVSHGYNAYSILKTGMDEWRKSFPIINFRAYGDYPLTLNLYLTIPFIKALGLNAFSIRLPHMLLGILTVLSTYFLVLGIFKKKNYALLTSLLVAIDPWFLFPSRGVFQSNISVFLLITSMALFFNRERKKSFLPLSLFILLLTLFSYHSTRIFSPILLISILFIYRDDLITFLKIKNIYRTLILGIISVFLISLGLIFLSPGSRARSQWVFLIDEGAINKINEQRYLSTLPQELRRFVYNKPLYILKTFSSNYIKYFSPKFLFIKGGTQYQFSNPKFGLLLYPNLIFFYIGILYVIYQAILKKERNYLFILIWFLFSPIVASITKEQYAVLRSTTILPIPEILSVLGFYFIFDFVKKKMIFGKILFGTYILSLFFCLYLYSKDTLTNYAKNYSWSWQYGYKEVTNYVKDNYSKYDRIIITKKYGEPHEFLLFFWPWEPYDYMFNRNLIRFNQSGWFWVDSFDKFCFVNDWQVPKNENEDFNLESGAIVNCSLENVKCLLVTSPDNYPKGWNKLNTINFLDGKAAFEIYENK